MLDQSLLQSHFIGRDGFRWWIGQIPPLESMGKQVTGGGWGNRFKVRILGYHPYSEAELPNEDLPWAQCLIPTTAGSGAANVATGIQLQQGDVVLGFFLDGDNAQIPVILATFGRTSSVPSTSYQSPFSPFTGFSGPMSKNSGTTPSENNEQKSNSLPSPQDVSPKQASQLSPIFGYQVVSTNSAIGKIVPLANTAQNTKISQINSTVSNLLKDVEQLGDDIEKIRQKIKNAVSKIVSVANEFVGGFMNTIISSLSTVLSQGVKLLYDLVYSTVLAATANPVVAHLAGVEAQKAVVGPVKVLEDSFSCIAGSVINQLTDTVTDIITSVVDNVDRFVSCASDQFVGSLLNSIIGSIESLISSPLAGVGSLLQFFGGYNVSDLMRSSIQSLAGGSATFDCNQSFTQFQGLVNEWVVGGGPKYGGENPYDGISNLVNSVESTVNCFTDALQFASPPIINIFGGTGSGASAVPIYGNVVAGPDGNNTASIIGVEVTNGGSGYTFPPFIEIVDDAGQGYGAVARSIINDKGEVTSIYIVSEGENYSIGQTKQYSVIDVIVENRGSGYGSDTTITDNLGNNYSVQIVNGSIYQVKPLNNNNDSFPIPVESLPVLRVNSETGFGAVLRPVLGSLTVDDKFNVIAKNVDIREIQTSIDCPE